MVYNRLKKMKKMFLVMGVFLSFGVIACAQNGGWKSKTVCEPGEKPVADKNGPYSVTITSQQSSATTKEGTQNHYNGNLNGEASHKTKTPVSETKVGASGGLGYSRDGEKTTNNSSKENSYTNTVNYNCVSEPKNK